MAVNQAILSMVQELMGQGLSRRQAAQQAGVPESTIRKWGKSEKLQVAPAPKRDEPLAELLERKRKAITRSVEHEEWANLIPVQVKDDKPIGVFMVGDPHLDDDGCDIVQLEKDLTAVGRVPGMYAGHIGDITNNWVGRLARLYAHQSTSFQDGLRLAEWMFGLCPNLFVVNGNHDTWGNGADLLRFIVSAGVHQSHGARLQLTWPGGERIRIHARHDFPGKSQFSDTHGMKREVLWGHRDHILVAGHTHVDEARCEPSLDGQVHWMFRVSGYKVIDEFAKEHNFRRKRLAPGVALIIDPRQRIPAERVKPFWDVEAAGAYLSWLRR